ncbi:1,4-beta-D-glucan glucohydrolase [Gilvimarinus agarilyticus]|uniref:GDSL-type esterase/lipase family protein n=1 Tax=Gilvimarinus sp. 2_MG-2023 TaxID=3062666 RepID=UPI001C08BC4B|nr:GDSL-type esterase/lipase family protein [Gilvimarinus sp. 2_MG-2023]MBU2884299.1 1,4-beta-D-glucan glucohydrolase [Gilvimarinus agarilyticus]MDO6569437.1 GDSL-type esterase/lipase family protein [Gilvimarinus sp. 2_MG-2023]
MRKVFLMSAAALALVACTSLSPEPPQAIKLLPAHGNTEFELFTHDTRQTFRGDALTVGDSNRATTLNVSSAQLELSWHDSRRAGVDVQFKRPQNLELYRSGAYVFDLQIEQLINGGFDLTRLCDGGCERSVMLGNQVAPLVKQGPHTVALPMSCVVRESDSLLAQAAAPLQLRTSGTGKLTLSDLRIEPSIPNADIVFECPDYQTVSVTPAPLDTYWSKSWWLPRHEQKLKAAKASDPQLVFLGDSITQSWERSGQSVYEQAFAPWPSLNLGFSGDRTENVLWRLNHGEVDNINPELLVLMIGTNNTGHRQDEPAVIARGVEQILTELKQRLPDTKVLMLAIFPRGATADDYARRNNTLANARLRNFADGERVFFADLNSVFLDKNGNLTEEIMPDLLHPNEYGYQLLANELVPLIRKHMDR